MFLAHCLRLPLLDFRALDMKRFGRINPPFLKSVSISLDVIHILETDLGRQRSSNNRDSSYAETVFLGRGLVGLAINEGMVSIITICVSYDIEKNCIVRSSWKNFNELLRHHGRPPEQEPRTREQSTMNSDPAFHDAWSTRLPILFHIHYTY